MMRKIKIIISKLIWKVTRISPKWDNRVNDILGYENYCKVIIYKNMK